MDYPAGLSSGTGFSIVTRSIYPNDPNGLPDYPAGLLSGTGFSIITRSMYPNDPNGLPDRPLIRYSVQYSY